MKGVAYHKDVIVDGLGDANNIADHAILETLILDCCSSCIAAVATHNKHHINAPHVYALHNLPVCTHYPVPSPVNSYGPSIVPLIKQVVASGWTHDKAECAHGIAQCCVT